MKHSMHNQDIITQANKILSIRGIEGIANQYGWQVWQRYAAHYWRYPVYDLNEQITGYRYKGISENAHKYAWFEGKPDGADLYLLPGTTKAIQAAGGVCYLANGEPSVLAYHAAGIHNALSAGFGEGSIPRNLPDLLKRLGVKQLIYIPDKDETGRKSAAKVRDALDGQIQFTALAWGEAVPDKGDANDLWMALDFNAAQFRDHIENLAALVLPKEDPKPLYRNTCYAMDDDPEYERTIEQVKMRVADLLGVRGYKSNGWSRNNVTSPFRDEKRPSASFNRESGVLNDFGGDSHSLYELAEYFNIPYPTRKKRPAKPLSNKAGLDAAPGDDQPTFKDRIQTIHLPQFQADWRVNYPYISNLSDDELEFMFEHKSLLIRSPIGTGKTELVRRVIARMEQRLGRRPRVLVITHLQALAEDIANRLKMECYKGLHAHWLPMVTQLVISYDSLHKIPENQPYDLVVIDEIEQFHKHLGGGTLRGGKAARAYQTLVGIVRGAGMFIGLDAHASNTSRFWLHDKIGGKVACIENTYCPDRGELVLHEREETVIAQAMRLIEEDDGVVVIPTSSKKRSEVYHHLIKRYGEQSVILVNSDNSESDDTQDLIRNINRELPHLRALVCSPSLATGIDVKTHVRAVCAVILNRPLEATDALQLIGRYRNAQERHIYVQGARRDLETDWRELYMQQVTRIIATDEVTGSGGITTLPRLQGEILSLQTQLEAEANMQRRDLLSAFVTLAKREGYRVTYSEGRDGSAREAIREARDEIKEIRKERIISAEPIDHDQLEYHRQQRTITPEIRYGYERFKIEDCVGQTINGMIYNHLHNPRRREVLRRFTDLEEKVERLQGRDCREAEYNYLVMKRKHYTVTRDLIHLAIVSVYSDGLESVERVTERTINERLEEYLRLYLDYIRAYLDERGDLSKRPLAVFRRILKRVGLTLKRHRVTINGDRIWFYSLDAESIELMRGYAASRRKHIAKKEKRIATFTGRPFITRESGRDPWVPPLPPDLRPNSPAPPG